ncbi:hypothetical protein CPAV1605_423 [seawater metagenome]|uniref:Endonuclease/exonuclease/phosphatase domain-containing protein n=1 Tax=seawater metagenome TaxID=1561972 RepID=A0A5E8CH04_9ZZZZ
MQIIYEMMDNTVFYPRIKYLKIDSKYKKFDKRVENFHRAYYKLYNIKQFVKIPFNQDLEKFELKAKESQFRILSWNIHGFLQSFDNTGKVLDFFKPNSDGVINIIKKTESDVVCLQEFEPITYKKNNDHTINNFFNKMQDYKIEIDGKLVNNYLSPNIFHGLATISINQLIKNIDIGKTIIPNKFTRYHLGTKLTYNNEDFLIINIHLRCRNLYANDLIIQIKNILNIYKENAKKENIIIIGDFNFEVKNNLDKISLANYKKINLDKPNPNFTSFNGLEIDQVIVSNYLYSKYNFELNVIPTIISDHYPIILDLYPKN